MNMLLLLHILIALTSIVWATLHALSPSMRKLKLNRALIAATMLSGTALVWQTNSPIIGSCLAGLAYLAVVGSMSLVAHHRLSRISLSARD